MFCPKCGNELPEKSKFCPGCGGSVRRRLPELTPISPGKSRGLRVLCWVLALLAAAEGVGIGWLITKLDRPLFMEAALVAPVPEPAETTETAETVPATEAPTEPPVILWKNRSLGEQVARKLGLPVDEITHSHAATITELKLDITPEEDLRELELLPGLTTLALQCDGDLNLAQLHLPRKLKTLVLRGRTLDSLEPLAALTDLEALDLSFHASTQVDLAPLSSLTGLRLLELGNLTAGDWSPLGALTGLESLSVTNCDLKDLSPLSQLTAMTRLSISGCEVKDLDPISGLENLTSLYLTSLPLEDLWPIAGLTQLESLGLWNCRIKEVKALADLENLKTLNLTGNEIKDLSPLMELPVWSQHGVRSSGTPDEDGIVTFE